jgi:toxin ParE1/3/4
VTGTAWTVRLSDAAEADYAHILRWTAGRFGTRQAARYGDLLATALARLGQGPDIPGVRRRDDIAANLLTLHVGRRGRHFILFRAGSEPHRTMDVLRLLHDAMDLTRHVTQPD